MDEAAKGYQHLQNRKRTRDSNRSRRHSLQSMNDTVGVRSPTATSNAVGLRANPACTFILSTQEDGRWPSTPYRTAAVGRMVTFFSGETTSHKDLLFHVPEPEQTET